jgi:hypothetical protein
MESRIAHGGPELDLEDGTKLSIVLTAHTCEAEDETAKGPADITFSATHDGTSRAVGRAKRPMLAGHKMTSSNRVWVDKKMRKAKQNKHRFQLGAVGICLIICYILLGSLGFQSLQPTYTLRNGTETDTAYLDALYFSVVCLSTVGFGDITPSNDGELAECIQRICSH